MTALGVGLVIGVVVGLLGAGGGILSVPALLYLLDQSPYTAAIGSLVGVTLTSAGSLLVHARSGDVRIKEALLFGALSIVGALGGARASLMIDDDLLLRIFSVFLIIVGIAFVIRSWRTSGSGDVHHRESSVSGRRLLGLVAVASLTGILTGLFGVGGGFMIVPALVLVMKVPMKEAVGTSLLVMIMTSLAGIAGRLPFEGGMDWKLIGLFVAGSIAGGLIGSVFSTKLPARLLTMIFAVLVLAVGIYSAVQSWL